jgi:hypothetical protein
MAALFQSILAVASSVKVRECRRVRSLHVVRAITDDAAIAVKLPDDNQAAVELRFNFDYMRADARDQLGLSLNLPKCALLCLRAWY